MQHRNWLLSFAAIACLIASPLTLLAQQPAANDKPQVVAVTAERPLAGLLPDKLAGVKAAGDVKQFNADGLTELVGDQATIYREYYVTRAASRQYGAARVDVFASSHPFGAFGLLTFYGAAGHADKDGIGTGSARMNDALVFWKDNYFVRITAASGRPRAVSGDTALARAVASELPAIKPDERPVILRSLPEPSRLLGNQHYFLGPETLNTAVPGSRDLYAFNGDAEAVVAQYNLGPDARAQHLRVASPMKLIIVEYHTPQFAFDAIARADAFVNSLSEADRQRIIIKREGNYIVEAVNFDDRNAAQAIVDAVQYPYGVQWLHHPSIPSPDPFRGQKAAQMLLSTFSLLGVLLGSVLVGGCIFGTTMFLKRRKRMQAVFSDAGDMLRLDIDPFEEAILGLPPKRD
ncbi:MAG TPA: DUF6599 family protein [Blastocatellia bacterium]|nr:DUF6599 family protein [Blastocatellia bacterium]